MEGVDTRATSITNCLANCHMGRHIQGFLGRGLASNGEAAGGTFFEPAGQENQQQEAPRKHKLPADLWPWLVHGSQTLVHSRTGYKTVDDDAVMRPASHHSWSPVARMNLPRETDNDQTLDLRWLSPRQAVLCAGMWLSESRTKLPGH